MTVVRARRQLQFKDEKARPNGYASLDANGLIPDTQIGVYSRSHLSDLLDLDFFSKLLIVDQTNGNNAFASSGRPLRSYSTIAGAIADAVSGELILLMPGTYNLATGITIPNGVSMRGVSLALCAIQMLNVAAATTLITMGENCRVEDITLKLTSAGHHTLKGIAWPGTTSATSKLRTAVLTVDNSAAGAGSSVVCGSHSYGTSTPHTTIDAIRATTINVISSGTGAKRGILVDTNAHNFNVRDVNVYCRNGGTAGGSYIGGEVNIAGGKLAHSSGKIQADSADISQSAGELDVSGGTILLNGTSNAKNFKTLNASFPLRYADSAALPSNQTQYFRVGTATVSSTEVKTQFNRATILKDLNVRSLTGPGGTRTDTFIIRKNGVDTLLQATLTGAETQKTNSVDAVSFATGDDLSVKVVTATATQTSDVVVTVDLY